MTSINKLLQEYQLQALIAGQQKNGGDVEGSLYNPDIPGDRSGNMSSRELEKMKSAYDLTPFDKYMQLTGLKQNRMTKKIAEVNGNYLRMPQPKNLSGPDNAPFYLDDTIDPNARSSRDRVKSLNPLVQPYDYVGGAEGYNFHIPMSAMTVHDQTQLINTARMSYASRMVSYGDLPAMEYNPASRLEQLESQKALTKMENNAYNQDLKKYQDFSDAFDLPQTALKPLP